MNHDHSATRLLDRLSGHREATFWGLQVLGWSAYFVTQWVSALFYPDMVGEQNLAAYLRVLAMAAGSGFALSCALRTLFRHIRDRRMVFLVPVSLAAIYAAALLWRLCINEALSLFMFDRFAAHDLGQFFASALVSTYLLLLWSALYYGIYFQDAAQRERLAAARAEGLARETQLKMLRYQLNPHFLFNTLNAISTLVLDHDSERAHLAVMRLSGFLRHSLDQDPMKRVTLQQELSALELYLDIEQLRFGSRLSVAIDVAEGAAGALVPSLLLQPLVENALKHAIAPLEVGGKLQVRARLVAQALHLEVADNGPGLPGGGIPTDGRGVGLSNTRERLAVLYGERAELTGFNTEPGCLVRIRLPAEFAS